MFASAGRRLALLNGAVVVVVIALTGTTTFALLRRSLDREADRALHERADAARELWADLFISGQPVANGRSLPQVGEDDGDESEEEEHDEEDEDEGHDLLESGDALLYAFDAEGRLLADLRGVAIDGLPVAGAVAAALGGDDETRDIEIDGERVRVRTEPVFIDGRVAGAIQMARGQAEHEAELRLVEFGSLVGVGLGVLIAVPAGLFLARRAMRPIDAAFARQRAFVADASHELRTPLTLIRATTELLQRLPESPEVVRVETGQILVEVDSMSRLVDDLLLLARVDDAALILDREATDLAEIAGAAVGSMTAAARIAGLSLTLQRDHPVVAYVDAVRIRQVMRILLDNAIAYTPAGGAVLVAVEQRSSKASVLVTDTGVGIARDDQERVFDRFYRADRARSRAGGGTGLGLTIARALVEAHGGAIGLESEPGRGTTVRFTLPLASGGAGTG